MLFGFIVIPLRIQGRSMEPTYHDGSFALCWRPQYLFSDIERFDLVTVRFSGRHVMLLKRIIALAGDTVEFRQGILYVNEQEIQEDYVTFRTPWNLEPRVVKPDHVYVVGDNRGTPMARHRFGQVQIERITGGVFP
jgi:signal peptidase I